METTMVLNQSQGKETNGKKLIPLNVFQKFLLSSSYDRWLWRFNLLQNSKLFNQNLKSDRREFFVTL